MTFGRQKEANSKDKGDTLSINEDHSNPSNITFFPPDSAKLKVNIAVTPPAKDIKNKPELEDLEVKPGTIEYEIK